MAITGTKDPDKISQLTYEECCRLIRENPAIVMRHVHKRFRAILDFITKGSSRPLGEVIHFYCRAEYQLRGSVHYHCLFWIKNAPNFEMITSSREIVEFIEKYISVGIPSESEDVYLRQLVKTLQTHKCTHTCNRKDKKSGCRFRFPKLSSESTVLHPVLTKRETRFYTMRRSVDEININPYNADILRMWGANMDIQCVSNFILIIPEFLKKNGFFTGEELVCVDSLCLFVYNKR